MKITSERLQTLLENKIDWLEVEMEEALLLAEAVREDALDELLLEDKPADIHQFVISADSVIAPFTVTQNGQVSFGQVSFGGLLNKSINLTAPDYTNMTFLEQYREARKYATKCAEALDEMEELFHKIHYVETVNISPDELAFLMG